MQRIEGIGRLHGRAQLVPPGLEACVARWFLHAPNDQDDPGDEIPAVGPGERPAADPLVNELEVDGLIDLLSDTTGGNIGDAVSNFAQHTDHTQVAGGVQGEVADEAGVECLEEEEF